jgi:D-ribose pyranase
LKKTGILHSELSKIIATLGHGQTITIADCGLPVPNGVPCIDLALKEGVPGFLDTLETVLSELVVEKYTIATELTEKNPALFETIDGMTKTPKEVVSHEAFKEQTKNSYVIIRTGEWTPYANVILHAGVAF